MGVARDALTTLAVDVVDGVAWVTLNRPEVLNAFDETMLLELAGVWDGLREDDTARVVVLTGAGDRAFCAGYDRSGLDDPDALEGPLHHRSVFHRADAGEFLGPKSRGLWKPVITAVNGLACGGAFYLLGESDIVIAAEHATFFDPHLSYGMPAIYEPVHLLSRLPLGEVLRMALLGSSERLTAATALRLGLVSEVVAGEDLAASARRLAEVIAAAPPLAVESTVRTIRAAHRHGPQVLLELGQVLVDAGTDRDAFDSGQAQFSAGARPRWWTR